MLANAGLTFWTVVVRDDGNGIGFLMVLMAAAMGAYATRLRAAGMARALVGVAVMQIVLGVLIGTAPAPARIADGPFKIFVSSCFLATLWLAAAFLFRSAAQGASIDTNRP